MNENVDIFVYTHKPFKQIVHNPVYKVLTCSHEEFDSTLPVLRDYEGDSISDKNLMYNEYTGLYWLWKNYDIKDYIGLNHYRRYYEWMDDVPDIEFLMKLYKIILNKPVDLICPVTAGNGVQGQIMDNREWYAWWHNVEDFDILEQLYHEKFPEYVNGFDKMKNNHYIYNSSMFTMSRDMFKEYCDYVFTVLSEYNKYRGMFTSDDYRKHVNENTLKYVKPYLSYYNTEIQSRVIGYIAERVMNTYMLNGDKPIENSAAIINWKHVE